MTLNSEYRKDAFQKLIVLSLNGTIENPNGSRLITGIMIPIMITYPNLGPPSFESELEELRLK